MAQHRREIRFDDHTPGETYAIASGLTVPRPIAWLGTIDDEGRTNLAPYSFFNMVCADPPTFVVAPGLGGRKDSLVNMETTGVATINVVTSSTAAAMNASAASVEAGVSEFELAGVTPVVSATCAAPRVAEAAAAFECRVANFVPVGRPGRDPRGAAMVVVLESDRVHVDPDVMDGDHRIDHDALQAIGRLAGSRYSHTSGALFDLERPA